MAQAEKGGHGEHETGGPNEYRMVQMSPDRSKLVPVGLIRSKLAQIYPHMPVGSCWVQIGSHGPK